MQLKFSMKLRLGLAPLVSQLILFHNMDNDKQAMYLKVKYILVTIANSLEVVPHIGQTDDQKKYAAQTSLSKPTFLHSCEIPTKCEFH